MFQASMPDAVPHAVGLRHLAALVDQDVEGQARLLDVAAHRVAVLREHARHLDAAGGVGGDVGGELTEPAAAVRSPGAAVERQQQPAAREEVDERARASLLVGEA